MVKNGIHDRVDAVFYIINMAEQNNVEFVLRRKSCLLFFYIFLFIFRFAGQMHAELFEDALKMCIRDRLKNDLKPHERFLINFDNKRREECMNEAF